MSLSRRSLFVLLASLPVVACTTFGPTPPQIFQRGGPAINGYDPVAYFTERRPVLGQSALSTRWKDATWYFSSAANRDAFISDPHRYAPAYGGYCAYAAAQGSVVRSSPEAWTIHEGTLYLNVNKRFQRIWEKDIPGYLSKAEALWPEAMPHLSHSDEVST